MDTTQTVMIEKPEDTCIGLADNVDLDAIVEQLRQMQRNSKLALAIDVGHLVVERLYGGDRNVLRQHGNDHVCATSVRSSRRD